MPGIEDYEFQTPNFSSIDTGTDRRRITIAVAAVAIVAIAVGVYFFWPRRADVPAQQVTAPITPPAAASAQSVDAAPALDLPPLANSDAFMREQIGALSSNSVIATWLRQTGLVHNLVLVIDNASRGLNPARHLRVLKPAGTFRVIQQGNGYVLDPRNYQRFTPIIQAAASVDPTAAAKVYIGIKPLLQTAYDELGNQEPIDRALERAMQLLLSTPVVESSIRLDEGDEGIGYRFTSASLESLSGAQKQLVRMGPEHQRLIQSRLREFAVAAGIAANRLPASR